MNLKALVDSLSTKEREELLNILTGSISTWTTMPPHIVDNAPSAVQTIATDFTMNIKKTALNNKRKEPVKSAGNQFVDTGEDRDIETPNKPLTPRTRKPPAKKNVTCHVCNKQYKINASLVYGEYYRCDNCIKG